MSNAVETETTAPGTRVIGYRGVPGGSWGGYVAPGIYEAVRRADGVLTWRLVENPLGTFIFQGRSMFVGYRSAAKCERYCDTLAESLGIESVGTIRHGRRCP